MSREDMHLSIVAPAFNERGNLAEFIKKCLVGFSRTDVRGEIIIVDDGSSDGSADELRRLHEEYPDDLRVITHRKNMGLTQALRTGFRAALGTHIIWISPDLEAFPDDDIPIFVQGFEEGADVVAGVRLGRGDGKNLASSIYNFTCRKLFDLDLKDMNWMKGFKRECLEALELRGDWHRFILVMLHERGYKIVEKEMQWHHRTYGVSKFGLTRFPLSLLDALSIWFLFFFGKKPMRLFGGIALSSFAIALSIMIGLSVYYISTGAQVRPLFWSALVLALFSSQMLIFGFIGELSERIRDQVQNLQNELGNKRD